MASLTFVDGVTVPTSTWFQPVNDFLYSGTFKVSNWTTPVQYVGINCTASAWNLSGGSAIELGYPGQALWAGTGSPPGNYTQIGLAQGVYYAGSNWKYSATNAQPVSALSMISGGLAFSTAIAGTVGNTATMTNVFSVDVNGNATFSGKVTDSTSGAFSTYSPTISSTSGTISLASGTVRYNQVGKKMFLQATINITTNGTGAGAVQVSLPTAASSASGTAWVLAGRAGSAGNMLQVVVPVGGTVCSIITYNNLYPGANGETLYFSGWYEVP